MLKRKTNWIILAILAIATVAALPTRAVRSVRLSGALRYYQSTNPPSYTVKLTETITSRETGRTRRAYSTTARRRDGSIAAIGELPDRSVPGGYRESRELRMANGVHAYLTMSLKLKTTLVNDQSDHTWLLRQRDPSTGCQRTFLGDSAYAKPSAGFSVEFAGMDNVHGYAAYKEIDKSGGSTWTIWRGRDFGCEIIQHDVVFPNGSTSHKEPTMLELGEPDPNLFEVPSDFKEASFTETYLLLKRAATNNPDATLTGPEAKYYADLDKKYNQAKHQGQ